MEQIGLATPAYLLTDRFGNYLIPRSAIRVGDLVPSSGSRKRFLGARGRLLTDSELKELSREATPPAPKLDLLKLATVGLLAGLLILLLFSRRRRRVRHSAR